MATKYNPGDFVILRAARIISFGPSGPSGYSYWVEFTNRKRVYVNEEVIYKKAETQPLVSAPRSSTAQK